MVRSYGAAEAVRVEEIPTPVPWKGEALVRVASAAVTAGDQRFRTASFPSGLGAVGRLIVGLRRPRKPVLGRSLAGTIVEVGPDAPAGLRVGDRVCGFTGGVMGAHAEYAVARGESLAVIPDVVSFDDAAAAIFGGTTALHFLVAVGGIGTGSRVLVNGASGEVGSAAVQLAVHFGAAVTAVTSARNAELVRSIGAERVIDYATESMDARGGDYDIVMDTVGNLPIEEGKALLAPGGRLLLLAAGLGEMLRARSPVAAGVAPERREDLETLLTMIEAGAFRPVIDARFDLDQVSEAHALAESGRKRGSALLCPVPSGTSRTEEDPARSSLAE